MLCAWNRCMSKFALNLIFLAACLDNVAKTNRNSIFLGSGSFVFIFICILLESQTYASCEKKRNLEAHSGQLESYSEC